MCYQTQEIHTL